MTDSFKKVNVNGVTKFLPIAPNTPNADFKGSIYDLPHNSLVLPDISRKDLLHAIKNSKSSISKKDLK